MRRRDRGWATLERLEDRRLLAADDAEPVAIIGGDLSERGQWPWVVSLQSSGGFHFCGGSLIAADAVLTAAHCVEGQSVNRLRAVVGRTDLTSTDGERLGVSEILIHPDYNALLNDFDVAVLLLDDVASAEPIAYLDASQTDLAAPGVDATALGWGSTREGGPSVSDLRQVNVPIVSSAIANQPAAYNGRITSRMLPAGLAAGGKDSCQGDSGGPLLVPDGEGDFSVAGIVSWGEGCARPNKYGIYTRVTEVAPWIDDIVKLEPAGTVSFAQDRYLTDGLADIKLRDADLQSADTVDVVVRSEAGDRETISLASVGAGRFQGTIPISAAEVSVQDGMLNVAGPELIHVDYQDQDDGTGATVITTDSARVIEDDFADDAEGAQVIAADETIRGEIELSGDVDWFQFESETGRAYEVSVLLNGSLDDSVVAILAEDGEMVLGFDDDSGRGLGSKVTFVPAAGGTNFIEVAGFGASVGTYDLLVEEVDLPDDDHANGAASATEVSIPSRARGNLESPTDVDWFAFDAVAGTNYQIDVNLSRGTLDDSLLRLFDTDGRTELEFNDDADFFTLESTIYWGADTSGRRFFEVSGFQGEQGTYEVSITAIDDDHGNLAGDATRLDVSDTTTRANGEITPSDVDWFVFTAAADEFYDLRTRLGTLPDSVLTIYDQDGVTPLANNDQNGSSNSSRILWQAEAAGDYFVEVTGFLDRAGTYELTVREVNPPSDDIGNRADLAMPISIPSDTTGNIQYVADVDWFAFEAFEGQRYTLQTQLGSLDDSVLRLFDSDGKTLLAKNDDVEFPDLSSRIVWTADSDGMKFIEVSAFDGERGRYTLEAARELAAGDLNQDNHVDASDIDFLFARIRDADDDEQLDLNNDDRVDSEDVDHLITEILGTVAGDTDLNGKVEFADFLRLSAAFGSAGGFADGNFDGDEVIQFPDFLILASNFGSDTTAEASRQVDPPSVIDLPPRGAHSKQSSRFDDPA